MSWAPTMALNHSSSMCVVVFSVTLGMLFPAKADPMFSNEECRAIIIVANQVFKKASNSITIDFKNSFARFLAPNGKLTCDGPTVIHTPGNTDIDAFNAIRLILASLDKPHAIDLKAKGIQAVK